jgi:hypothetical protein
MIILQKLQEFFRSPLVLLHLLGRAKFAFLDFINARVGDLHSVTLEYDNTLDGILGSKRSMRILEEMVMADGLFKE